MHATDWLQRRAELSPHRVALRDARSGQSLSYLQWNQQTNQLARFLRHELGVEVGERVAILAKNSIAYLDLWAACAKIGAVLQNLNWRLSAPELLGLLKDAGPRAFFYGPGFLEQSQALLDEYASACQWVAMGQKLDPKHRALQERSSLSDAPLPALELDLDAPWVLCYTGGTTGLPKGAILSHRNVWANAVNTIVSWGLDHNDVAVLNAPLFHTGGLNVFTSPLVYAGGSSIVCEGFDPDQLFDLLEEGGATVFFGVPTMFVMMQEHPRWEQADFSRLKFAISGGAPCPLPVFEKFWAKGVEFKTGYGLTEAGPNTFWLPKEYVQRKPGAVGVPLMHVELRILDEAGSQVEPGEVGELVIRGPHVTQGYWGRPEATAEALRDGWLFTGDLASQDADGFYSIVGRRKDMIISGGENIYPAEIESQLHGHPDVAEAAVVGLPHPKWGEQPVAFVRLHPDAKADAEALREFCSARMAKYKVPRRFELLHELPKTGAGKIDKRRLAHDAQSQR